MELLKNLKQRWQNFQWPKIGQWRRIFDVSSRREKIALLFSGIFFLVGAGLLLIYGYQRLTIIVPNKGGEISIGVLGAPQFFNPVLTQTGDADYEICTMIFSGLMKYDGEGNLINDLAQSYAIGDNGRIYDITLKPDVKWHDGQPLTADDVIFTLQAIQNPDFRSPLKSSWQGIEVEKIDELVVRFKLKKAYAPFLNSLNFGILPKHIWQNIEAARFSLTEQNQKPIGSGPYKIKTIAKENNGRITSVELAAFDGYFLGRPYLDKIKALFYLSEEEIWTAYKKNYLDAFGFASAKNWLAVAEKNSFNLNVHSPILPRYFAIFFNQEANKLLAEKTVRQALAYSLDKKELVAQIFGGFGEIVNSPLLKGMTGWQEQIKIYDFAPEHAKNLLAAAGWQDTDGDQVLEKANQKLEITLTTADRPELIQAADFIKDNWAAIGVAANVEIQNANTIQTEIIKPRQYQAILFGELPGVESDLFHFWHSSQKKENGLNLALYENAEVDKLLTEGQGDLDYNSRAQKYAQAVNLILEDLPAIFLYTPDYIFAADKDIQGINLKILNIPAVRFSQINEWFIKTTRSWRY